MGSFTFFLNVFSYLFLLGPGLKLKNFPKIKLMGSFVFSIFLPTISQFTCDKIEMNHISFIFNFDTIHSLSSITENCQIVHSRAKRKSQNFEQQQGYILPLAEPQKHFVSLVHTSSNRLLLSNHDPLALLLTLPCTISLLGQLVTKNKV